MQSIRIIRFRIFGMLVTLLISALASAATAHCSSSVRGVVKEFISPGGVSERCIALEHMPGGKYTAGDAAREAELCAVDFYSDKHALCPKVFSTNPGTLVYNLAGSSYSGNPQAFEDEACSAGGLNKKSASGKPISYKMSVNAHESSATFANSSLLYYHFSRYFQTTVHVPVAVFRSIDRKEHNRRVSSRGVKLSAGRPALRMNHAAWKVLHAAEQDPSNYKPTEELFTPEGLLYGVMLHQWGKRYNAEINGTRESGWGDGQNRDFQETAPFRALRSNLPLADAVEEGIRLALQSPKLAEATRRDATQHQIVYWMSDLVDITLLDFIFSQQDRIGNIDFVPYWYWISDGKLQVRQAAGRKPPPDSSASNPVYLKRTELGDNDAGVRVTYANFTKRTGMLEKLRHYRADVYRQLMRLDKDFKSGGPLHRYGQMTFGLSKREFAQIVNNTRTAATILRESCKAGRLRFDIDPEQFLLTGAVVVQDVDCESP